MNRWLPAIIICLAGLLTTVPAWNDSYTYNENGRLASGVIYLKTGDYASFHVNPPLVSLVGAIPATLAGAKHATRCELGISSFSRDEYRAGDLFIEKNPNHRYFLFAGRLCCILLVFIGFRFAFQFVQTLYGRASAYLFLGMGLFSPYVLGFGGLIVPDVLSALLGMISVYFFWRWLLASNHEKAFIAGIALGLAELTKFTLLIFYPLFVMLWLVYKSCDGSIFWKHDFMKQSRQMLVLFAVSLFVINMGYLFEGTGKQLGSFKFQTTLFTGCKMLKQVPACGGNRFDGSKSMNETVLGYIPAPLPKNFIQGIDTQRLDFERGMPSYLRGEWADHGWLCYYLYALLIKTPIGTIGVFLLAIVCSIFLKGYNLSWRDEMVVLLPGITILVFVGSQTGFSTHSRYVIPALPFFFAWTSKVGRAFTSNTNVGLTKSLKLLRFAIVIFLLGSVASSMSIYPHSISYFNELAVILPTPADKNVPKPLETRKTLWQRAIGIIGAGPRNGPRHLLDSNIDWGQDLYYLERWLARHSEAVDIKVAYWGSYPSKMTNVLSRGTPAGNDPRPGWYALSVNYLYGREKEYRYFLCYEPVATAGYSINIYRITKEQANHVRSEMGLTEVENE